MATEDQNTKNENVFILKPPLEILMALLLIHFMVYHIDLLSPMLCTSLPS